MPAPLSQRQKAAVIVRFLLNEGADLPLSDLPEKVQSDLIQLIGSMRYVDRETLGAVVLEFAGQLENVALAFPSGIGNALDALDGQISPLTAARLRKEAGVRDAGDPWDRLRALDTEKLVPLIQGESVEVAAVLLSKLDVAQAAELLGKLSGDLARRITLAVSRTSAIAPAAVERIGLSLATQIAETPRSAFAEPPDNRVGAILNHSGSRTREAILDALNKEDAGFAEQVRQAIFTFADIPARLASPDVPKVVRDVDQAMLVTLLAGDISGDEAAALDYLMSNMSSRVADQLRDEASERKAATGPETEKAMTNIAGAVSALAAAGEIELVTPEKQDG